MEDMKPVHCITLRIGPEMYDVKQQTIHAPLVIMAYSKESLLEISEILFKNQLIESVVDKDHLDMLELPHVKPVWTINECMTVRVGVGCNTILKLVALLAKLYIQDPYFYSDGWTDLVCHIK